MTTPAPSKTMPASSKEEATATLSTLARTLLFISVGLAGVMTGYGFGGAEDSSWIQVVVEVAVPFSLFLIVGYVLMVDGYRRKSCS